MEPLAATVTIDPNHRSVIIGKALRDFETADAEGKKQINAKLKELGAISSDEELIGIVDTTETWTEYMARMRREKKRAHLRVVASDDKE
jgi:hypothetical protein